MIRRPSCSGTAGDGRRFTYADCIAQVCPRVKMAQVAGIVVGEGFRFGYKAAGTTDTLRILCKDLDLMLNVVDLVKLSAASHEPIVSSSEVGPAETESQVLLAPTKSKPMTITALFLACAPGKACREPACRRNCWHCLASRMLRPALLLASGESALVFAGQGSTGYWQP